MLTAVTAVLAALLTFASFVAPTVIGSTMALAIAAITARLATLFFVRRMVAGAGDMARRGVIALVVGEVLLLAATILRVPPEPHLDAGGIAGWASLALWIIYGAACIYGGVKLITVVGWMRFAGIGVAVSAGFWFTQVGLLVWPFTMAAAYLAFAVAGLKGQPAAAT